MPNDNAIKLGILKCRDLVELYYGARMVVDVVETNSPLNTGQSGQILTPDPRRIKYEIVLQNLDVANPLIVDLSTKNGGGSLSYAVTPNSTIVIERDFLSDFEGVCSPVFAAPLLASNAFAISTRETFLTPIPVDEMP